MKDYMFKELPDGRVKIYNTQDENDFIIVSNEELPMYIGHIVAKDGESWNEGLSRELGVKVIPNK